MGRREKQKEKEREGGEGGTRAGLPEKRRGAHARVRDAGAGVPMAVGRGNVRG